MFARWFIYATLVDLLNNSFELELERALRANEDSQEARLFMTLKDTDAEFCKGCLEILLPRLPDCHS